METNYQELGHHNADSAWPLAASVAIRPVWVGSLDSKMASADTVVHISDLSPISKKKVYFFRCNGRSIPFSPTIHKRRSWGRNSPNHFSRQETWVKLLGVCVQELVHCLWMHTQVHCGLIGCDQALLQRADTSLRHDSQAHTVSYLPRVGQEAHSRKRHYREYLTLKGQVQSLLVRKLQDVIKIKVTSRLGLTIIYYRWIWVGCKSQNWINYPLSERKILITIKIIILTHQLFFPMVHFFPDWAGVLKDDNILVNEAWVDTQWFEKNDINVMLPISQGPQYSITI